jgi:hypothetical protein
MAIQYQETTDREIHDRVRKKRRAVMEELVHLGFREHSFYGETVHAFGFDPLGLTGFLGMWIALFKEVTRVELNLDVTIFNVLMASREYAAYAGPFGLGVKFYTTFTDGTFIISANFDTPEIQDQNERIYKMASPGSISSSWSKHRQWVEKLCADGKQKVEHLSLADFLRLSQREDAYLMKMQYHQGHNPVITF